MRDAGPLCQVEELMGVRTPSSRKRRPQRRLGRRALALCGGAGLVAAVLAAAWPVGPSAEAVTLALRQDEGRRLLGWMAAQGQLGPDAAGSPVAAAAPLPQGWIVACVQPEAGRAFVPVSRSSVQTAALCELIAFDAPSGRRAMLGGQGVGLHAVVDAVRAGGPGATGPVVRAALVFDPRVHTLAHAVDSGPPHYGRAATVAAVLLALLLLGGRQLQALHRLAGRVHGRRPEQTVAWARGERPVGAWVSRPVADLADALGDEIVLRQHAVERSSEALQLLRASWELSADGILLVTLDGLVTHRNAAALRLLRNGRADEARDGIPLAALLPGLGPQRLAELLGHAAALGGASAAPAGGAEPVVLCSFDGELRPFELRVRPVVTDGQPGLLVHLRPAPAPPAPPRPPQLSDARDCATRTLERELALPLAALRAELESSGGVEARGRRAAPVADPQRTPLGQVRGLLRDYFDLARAESDRLHLEHIPFDAGQQAARCVAEHQGAALAKGLKLGLRLPGERLVVQGDPRRFAQVLDCLLEHAIQIATGGGLLAVQLEAQALPDDAPETRLSVRISASGPGLPAHGLRLPNAPLDDQLDEGPSQGPAARGSAIGLALCHHLCRALNGGLSADHDERQGGTLRFWMDVLPAEGTGGFADTLPLALQAEAAPLRGRRALVVDDNPLDRTRLTYWLQREGMVVQQAPDGESALEALGRTPIDIVVTDLSMPGMDGLQATRRMRSRASSAELPIVGVSAYVVQSDAVTCVQLGMNAFLGKPVNRLDLVRTLADLLPAS